MRIDFTENDLNFMHVILTGLMKWLWLPGAFQSGYLEYIIFHVLPEIKAFICTSRQKMWVSTDFHTELQKPNWTIKFFKVSLQMAELLFLHVELQQPTLGDGISACL